MFSPVTKWADVVLTPGAVPEMVRKAFKVAQTERPGAVYLAAPEDVEAMGAPEGLAPLNVKGRADIVLADTGAVKMWMARLYPRPDQVEDGPRTRP